jgi:hypothetical protein
MKQDVPAATSRLPYIVGHMKQKVGHCSLDQQSGMQYAPET